MRTDDDSCWPALPYDAWKDTYATLHLWSQVVGKIALALGTPLNHFCRENMTDSNVDLKLLLAAAAFAARKHSTQRRKDAEASPYINHPLALADVLANLGGVNNALEAAFDEAYRCGLEMLREEWKFP